MSLLQVYKLDQIQDWERTGYYGNWWLTNKKCNSVNFLEFHNHNIPPGTTISEFKLRRLSIVNNIKSILETTTLSTGYIDTETGDSSDSFYYLGDEDLGVTTAGLYEYYIKTSEPTDDNEYISDLICYKEEGSITGGDFNNDFNDDFSIGVITGTTVLEITVKDLPNLYPETGTTANRYEEKLYASQRLVREGYVDIDVITKKRYFTMDDQINKEQRKIQSLNYKVYTLNIFGGEHSGIELLDKAGEVLITDTFGTTYKALFVEPVKSEKQADTEIRLYTLKFADINSNNYKDRKQPVSDFLTTGYLSKRFDTNTLIELKLFSGSKSSIFYGNLDTEEDVELNEHKEPFEKTNYIVQKVQKNVVLARFYLTDSEKSAYLDKVNDSDYKIDIKRGNSGTVYNNYQLNNEIEYSFNNDDLVNIWQLDIKLVYNREVSNYFSDAVLSARFSAGELYTLTMAGNVIFRTTTIPVNTTIKTPIGYLDVTETNEQADKDGEDLNRTFTVSNQDYYVLIYYVDGSTANDIKRYHKATSFSLAGAATGTNIEKPKIEVEKIQGFEDLWKVTVNLKTAYLITDLFAT